MAVGDAGDGVDPGDEVEGVWCFAVGGFEDGEDEEVAAGGAVIEAVDGEGVVAGVEGG